jgi:hypothetical protein
MSIEERITKAIEAAYQEHYKHLFSMLILGGVTEEGSKQFIKGVDTLETAYVLAKGIAKK